ncbi:MAG: hypothetical protein D6744_11675 [Planctomycetota bacterium]|nr:MAG: hypothetical protein D6744_11675 [Planctomycetota bacterium]
MVVGEPRRFCAVGTPDGLGMGLGMFQRQDRGDRLVGRQRFAFGRGLRYNSRPWRGLRGLQNARMSAANQRMDDMPLLCRVVGTWTLLAAGLLSSLTGCALIPPQSFLDPTKVGSFPLDYRESGIRRVLTPREAPYGIVNATEPTPEDLVPTYEEYRAGPLDTISVRLHDFLDTGRPWDATLEVSPTGYIRIPRVGPVRVLGMTEAEIEQDLRTRIQDAGILPDPLVTVIITTKRDQFFTAIGEVRNQGPFQLVRPDTRLLEVLGQLGGISPLKKKLYVIRRTDVGYDRVPDQPEGAPPPTAEEELIIPPPDDSDYSATVFSRIDAAQDAQPARAQPQEQVNRDELAELLKPNTGAESSPQSQPQGGSGFQPLIFDPTTGELREAPAERSEQQSPDFVPDEAPQPDDGEEFDWEAVPDYELSQRIIEIDLPALQAGDPRYNIVIRNRDLIRVPAENDVFYMMGEVNRPGVYAFGGREITLKQAIAIASGFSALAWPARCEIIRREPGTDKQVTVSVNLDRIFAGLDDDVLLRNDDIVNVGTHTIAPFLFIIRNSFRFTYGFGFVYDRNFADQDSIGGKPNPEVVERQRRAALGLPF